MSSKYSLGYNCTDFIVYLHLNASGDTFCFIQLCNSDVWGFSVLCLTCVCRMWIWFRVGPPCFLISVSAQFGGDKVAIVYSNRAS